MHKETQTENHVHATSNAPRTYWYKGIIWRWEMENVRQSALPWLDGRDLGLQLTQGRQLHHHLWTFSDKLLHLRHMNSVIASLQHTTINILLLLLLHLFNGLFSRTSWVSQYQKGKTSLDLNEARDDRVLGRQWQQLDHMQTICTSLQTDNHTNTSSLNFYRPDALPDAQPTVSKHWRHNNRHTIM